MSSAIVPVINSKFHSEFSPLNVPNCKVWLDASDTNAFTLSGSTVTAIRNKSNSNVGTNVNNVVTVVTGVTWASNSVNGRPAFNLNAGRIKGTLFSSDFSRFNHTAFIVAVADTTPGNGAPLMALSNNINGSSIFFRVLDYVTTPRFRAISFFAAVTASQIVPPAMGTPFLWSSSYIGSVRNVAVSNNPIVAHLNGGSITSTNVATAPTESARAFMVGTDGFTTTSNTNTWPGKVCEVLLYNQLLSDVERQTVDVYLARKWGLSANLPSPFNARPPPATRIFTPTSFAGCQLWLDASDRTSLVFGSGTNITQWTDRSGNNRSLISATGGTGTITYSTHRELPSVRFNSTDQTNFARMRVVSNVNLQNFTFFIVARSILARASQSSFLAVPSTGRATSNEDAFSHTINSTPNVRDTARIGRSGGTALLLEAPIISFSDGDAYPLRLTAIRVSSSVTALIHSNGVQSSGGALSARTTTATGFGIGFTITGSGGTPTAQNCISEFSEIIVYNTFFTDNQISVVEGYLGNKWKLTNRFSASNNFRTFPSSEVVP
jgi:hypothetical protein